MSCIILITILNLLVEVEFSFMSAGNGCYFLIAYNIINFLFGYGLSNICPQVLLDSAPLEYLSLILSILDT